MARFHRTMTDRDPRWIDENGDPIDEDHRGLVYDVQTLINRRRALGIFGGVALTSLLAACAAQPTDAATTPAAATPSATPDASGTASGQASAPVPEVPDETGGPFPAD